ncbi:MAG TPA: hypothetical protein VJ385_17995 [Fibrobacteria bacterium]|nr:hypothetical protein [Fibrobacteria bacterium]
MPSREFYLNADFDLSLRGRPSLLETSDPTFVHEMAWHFLFAGGSGDSLIVHRPLPEDFLEYLRGKGLGRDLPRLTVHPGFDPESEFTPFGWNAHAESLAQRYSRPPAHPEPPAVKTANSRAFGLELEREWGRIKGLHRPGGPEGRGDGEGSPEGYGSLFASLEGLESFLRGRTEPGGWVVKGDHGHAGTANRRVPSGMLPEESRKALADLLAGHGRVVAEPWDERLMDLSVNFTVEKGGSLRDFRGHELLNSRDGAFLGVKIHPSRLPPDPWREELSASAAFAAMTLDALGYSGPVSVDAYVRATLQGPRLRPLVDVNARHSMALPAHGLARRLPGKSLLWMWAKPRKLDLPADYAGLDARLGPLAFQAATGLGILAASPLRASDRSQEGTGAGRRPDAARPKRVGFLFSAADEGDLRRLQAGFAQALGRG